jgi:hypothetical protein
MALWILTSIAAASTGGGHAHIFFKNGKVSINPPLSSYPKKLKYPASYSRLSYA